MISHRGGSFLSFCCFVEDKIICYYKGAGLLQASFAETYNFFSAETNSLKHNCNVSLRRALAMILLETKYKQLKQSPFLIKKSG